LHPSANIGAEAKHHLEISTETVSFTNFVNSLPLFMNIKFRENAKTALRKAKEQLEAKDDALLRYAALELRICIEALTYDRAQGYMPDLPPSTYAKWQPKKLMEILIDLDPTADRGGAVRFKKESKEGQPEYPWVELGEERVFSLSQIKKSYDALGNFLHHPTYHQIINGEVPNETIRQKCEGIASQLDHVLQATVHNFLYASRLKYHCFDCEKPQIKRLKSETSDGEGTCWDCSAEHSFYYDQNTGKHMITRKSYFAQCPTEGCTVTKTIPAEKFKEGYAWKCIGCSKQFDIAIGIRATE